MRRRTLLSSLLGYAMVSSIALAACREPKSVPQLVSELRHPDPKERRHAADELRMDSGVPAEAIRPLLDAITVEKDKYAHGAMLITLGRSGVPEAKPFIDAAIPVADVDVRRWAARALHFWLVATGQMPESQELPDGWPYGQPGYPPPLPED
jgi:HEAT repeat protein